MCPEAQFGEESVYCFERNLVFSSAFVHRDFFCGFRQIIFGSVVKNAFHVSIEKFCGKTLFAGEKNYFFKHFRILGHFSTKTPTFWWNRQNCISSVEMYFEEVFLKSFFCYSWAWSKKIWSFVEEFPAGLSNFILGAHRNFLRNNLFFAKK